MAPAHLRSLDGGATPEGGKPGNPSRGGRDRQRRLAHRGSGWLFAAGALLVAGPLNAQWLTQEIPLSPGWNAVCLRVDPDSATCRDVFAQLPVDAAYQWNGRDQTLQFTTSPDRLIPRDDDWLVWLPPSHPQTALNTLHHVHANQAYLLRIADGATPFTWRVKGRPQLFRHAWRGNGLNLSGLPVPATTATFAGFFQSCDAIPVSRTEGGEIQLVNSQGRGTPVWTPARTRIEPGRAYWIRSHKSTDFTGPLRVETDFGTVLAFTEGKPGRRLTVQNLTDTALAVTLRLRPSEASPAGELYAPVMGEVPLNRRERDWSSGRPQTVYPPFNAPLTQTLAAGETWTLTLVLRERDLVADPPESVRLSLLEITAGDHFRDVVGLLARH